MKKKKLYLTAFLLVLALALQGGIFSGFSVPVQATEVGTIMIRTEKKLPAGTKVLQEISTISERPVQPKPEF